VAGVSEQRATAREALERTSFDLLVIGGGVIGTLREKASPSRSSMPATSAPARRARPRS
jgi:hypothetical protein